MNSQTAAARTTVAAQLPITWVGHSLRLQRQWACGGSVERLLSIEPGVMNQEMRVGRE